MKRIKCILWILSLSLIPVSGLFAQATIAATGGSATGIGGSVTYTIGQLSFSVFSGTNGSIIQGVQQPYEISIMTAIEKTEDITLEYSVYPNPTEGIIRLVIKWFNDGDFRYQLYNMGGIIIQEEKITGEETEIYMLNHSSAVYFLRIIRDNREVKVFKIVKK